MHSPLDSIGSFVPKVTRKKQVAPSRAVRYRTYKKNKERSVWAGLILIGVKALMRISCFGSLECRIRLGIYMIIRRY